MTNQYKCFKCGYIYIFNKEESNNDYFCMNIRDKHRFECPKDDSIRKLYANNGRPQ